MEDIDEENKSITFKVIDMVEQGQHENAIL